MSTSITSSPAEDRLLRPEEAAKYLGVSRGTMEHYRKIHRGPKYVAIHSHLIRYKLSDIQAYIAEQESKQ